MVIILGLCSWAKRYGGLIGGKRGFFSIQWFEVKGSCLFGWYWLNLFTVTVEKKYEQLKQSVLEPEYYHMPTILLIQ